MLLLCASARLLAQASSPTPTPTPTPTPIPTPPAVRENLAIKYVRDSEEYATLVREVYRAARSAVEASPRSEGWAVVLDVDETALDNSVYQLERAAYGVPFAVPSWTSWVQRAQAPAVPGVQDFVAFVHSGEPHGRVAWITDREGSTEPARDQEAATRANLKVAGLWADGDLLCVRRGDRKPDRRKELLAGSGACSWGTPARVVAWVGDQMGDFPAAAEPYADRKEEKWDEEFGRRFFLLPNPMYGRPWEQSVTRTDFR
ncbi:MAG: HAD family acid phosphatase [Acidobacteriota bacterium]